MDKTILTVFKVLSIVLIVAAVIFQILVLFQGEDNLAGKAAGILDNYILLSYIALALTALLAILFPVLFIIQNPKNAIKMLIALAVLAGIGFICYSVAATDMSFARLEELKTTVRIEKMVGASLFFTYVIGGLAILSIIYSGISSLFK